MGMILRNTNVHGVLNGLFRFTAEGEKKKEKKTGNRRGTNVGYTPKFLSFKKGILVTRI